MAHILEMLTGSKTSFLSPEAHREMGVANGGVVYALFPREATEASEMTICEGESLVVVVRGRGGEEEENEKGEGNGWWEVEGERGKRGMVPVTYLGSSPRYQVIL